MNENKKTYLGDGLYAEHNGHTLMLMTSSHDHPTNMVYLEPSVLRNLTEWLDRIKEAKK